VTPHHVFEIALGCTSPANDTNLAWQHVSQRIVRWRQDKPIEEANTLDDLSIDSYGVL
jgi:DNA ligase-1